MKELRRNVRLISLLMISAFVLFGAYFGYSVYFYGGRWIAKPYNPRITSQKQQVLAGTITDREGTVLASSDDEGERHYAASTAMRRAFSHVIGDSAGRVANGVETFHAQYLLGFKSGFLERLAATFGGEQRRGDDLQLTISAKLQAYIAEQFPSGQAGAVVVLNYKTGDVYAMVSKPDFDPLNTAVVLQGPDNGVLINRATQGLYPPGSVFKVVTLAGALESLPDANERVLDCTGALNVEHSVVTDAGLAVHGPQTIHKAFANSCNNAFAALALELGYDVMGKKAGEFGFNDNPLFKDIVMENASYPTGNGNRDDLAWSGVGQGRVLVTPLHMALIAGSVANGGVIMEPRLLDTVKSPRGQNRMLPGPTTYRRAMDEAIAGQILSDMLLTVKNGTATRAAVKGHSIGGKTGSAEATNDKQVNTHAWFIGFVNEADHPLAISVLVEYGGSGGQVAAPLASKFLKKALDLGL